jgi:hypothetical protein
MCVFLKIRECIRSDYYATLIANNKDVRYIVNRIYTLGIRDELRLDQIILSCGNEA